MFSPCWAAPEQLAGEQASPAADIYSLALVTIFMLGGEVAFTATEPVEAYRQRSSARSHVERALSACALPARAIDVLVQACSFDPERRHRHVELFTDALLQALAIDESGALESRGTPAGEHPALSAPTADLRRSSEPPTDRDIAPPLEPPPAGPVSTPPARPPRHLSEADNGRPLGDRVICLLAAPGGRVDTSCANGAARLRFTLLPTAQAFCLHVKGLSCFVAIGNGRPSSAVQFEQDGVLELLLPNRAVIARARILFGRPTAGHHLFTVAGETVALSSDAHPRAVVVDLGPQAECLFLCATPSSDSGARRRTTVQS
jgi:serine/threonine-protein kinase